jgi:hypothetical protein
MQEPHHSGVRSAGSALLSPAARVSQFVVSPPNAVPCRSRSWSVAARNILRPHSYAAPWLLPKARGSNFAASGVRPNPSLSRDPTRQAAWASCRAGLCCTTPPKRLAARVAVSSNVRPHTAGMGNRSTSAFQDARRVQIRASAAARIRRLQADEPSTGERHQSPHRKRSEATSFMCALRGIRPRLASPASRVNQSVVPPPSGEVCRSPAWSAAAKRSWACAATPRLGLSKARLANLCSVRRAA